MIVNEMIKNDGYIEMVVKLSEVVYRGYKRPPMLGGAGMDMIAQSIANGKSLPKGQGRLIDGDKLANEINVLDSYSEDAVIEQIKDAPTIIEADNAESDIEFDYPNIHVIEQ